ncbi:MAG: Bpu10I family restriction endonuclease [Chloroflexota bacterium]|nr:MAG: Bpu10I family restriction endonuclease [Chloroflexota bacterium]
MNLQNSHHDKLKALLENPKLPMEDKLKVQEAILRHATFIQQLHEIKGDFEFVINTIEMDLIFDSPNDFLYRQKGQIKLENTIIEEFLPILVLATLDDHIQSQNLTIGSKTCFSGIRFESGIRASKPGAGIQIREKDQDFALSRELFIQSSHYHDFRESLTLASNIAYLVAECKTNLDKTMFQEAAATAVDIKSAVPGAKYYLLCEWLDMTPISTSTTAIDEIIILRKARRLPSDIRGQFNTYQGRQKHRQFYTDYLTVHPFAVDTFSRFIMHIYNLITEHNEENVLSKGYF